MTRSPLSSRSPSLVMVSWVAAPAGTITQTVRGASRAFTIAAMVRTLCGPDMRYVTGQSIHVNGGNLMP